MIKIVGSKAIDDEVYTDPNNYHKFARTIDERSELNQIERDRAEKERRAKVVEQIKARLKEQEAQKRQEVIQANQEALQGRRQQNSINNKRQDNVMRNYNARFRDRDVRNFINKDRSLIKHALYKKQITPEQALQANQNLRSDLSSMYKPSSFEQKLREGLQKGELALRKTKLESQGEKDLTNLKANKEKDKALAVQGAKNEGALAVQQERNKGYEVFNDSFNNENQQQEGFNLGEWIQGLMNQNQQGLMNQNQQPEANGTLGQAQPQGNISQQLISQLLADPNLVQNLIQQGVLQEGQTITL